MVSNNRISILETQELFRGALFREQQELFRNHKHFLLTARTIFFETIGTLNRKNYFESIETIFRGSF